MQQHQGTSHQGMHQQVQSSVPIVHLSNMPSYEAPVKPIEQTSYSVNGQPTYNSVQFPLANQRGTQQSQYPYFVNNQPTNKYVYHQNSISNGPSKQNEIPTYLSHNKISVYNHDTKTAYSNGCSSIQPKLTASTTSSTVKNSYQSNYIAGHYLQPNGYYKTPVNGTMDDRIQAASLNQHPSKIRSMHGKYFNLFEIVPIQIIKNYVINMQK